MNRVEENAKILRDMKQLSGSYDFNGSVLIFLSMISTELADISKSLAIIADNCEGQNAKTK